jgi:hypothetical protein
VVWGGSVRSRSVTAVRIRNEEEAIAAYMASCSDAIPDGHSVAARCDLGLSFILEDGTCLWHIVLVPDDEAHMIFGGDSTFIGPDGKVWTFTANPNFYDHQIARMALAHLYIDGVADLVDAEALKERVEMIVTQRDGAIYALPDAARRGELRQSAEDN